MSDLIKVKEEDRIICPGCNSVLALLLITTVKEGRLGVKTRYKMVDCYKCGADAFVTKIFDGNANISAPAIGLSLEHVDTDMDDEGVITCILKTTKD